MVWVKICGTTNLEDAQAAVDAGADALGFVFADSPRRAEPAVAAEIAHAVPEHVERIGVFVNETAERIAGIVRDAGLTGIQLHGDESLDFAWKVAADLGSTGTVRVIPVFPIHRFREMVMSGGVNVGFGMLDSVLFDSLVTDTRGGSGKTWEWEMGRKLVENLRDYVKIIVAGGLTPANVADAIRTLRPWGVDVASGVEREPGKKDRYKVREFVKAAKNADF